MVPTTSPAGSGTTEVPSVSGTEADCPQEVEDPFGERFWTLACAYDRAFLLMFSAQIVFLLLLGFAASVGVDRGSRSYYILLVDFGLVLVSAVASGAVVWRCRAQQSD